jgi:diguanylate cyclase
MLAHRLRRARRDGTGQQGIGAAGSRSMAVKGYIGSQSDRAHAMDASQPLALDVSQPLALVIEPTREQGLRFARRMHAPRTIGLALGFLCVAAALLERQAPAWMLALLVANGFAWPHVAWLIASRSRDPYRAEVRNLLADSAFGGAWIAAMQFNALPSVMLFSMLAMDKISAGGARLFVRAVGVQALACLAGSAALGFAFQPATSQAVLLACLPLLVAYPIAVGVVTYRLSRRIREQNRQLGAISRTDGLTGVLNRAFWERAVSAELKRHRRHGSPAALMMLDIDRFKAVNDRHGHLVGDEVIQSVAALLHAALREQDVPGRYGGDEFGVLLPDTDLAGAAAIAERVRSRVAAAEGHGAAGLRCTVSVGIALADGPEDQVRQWIARADRALYRAKTLGRDRVVADAA